MEIYRWEGKGFRQLDPLRFEEERDFEDLLEQDPNLLLGNERICIISRQVPIGKSQKVDLLALDRQGNCIVIELKRGKASAQRLHRFWNTPQLLLNSPSPISSVLPGDGFKGKDASLPRCWHCTVHSSAMN